jgi:hypothetical protein
MDNFYVLSNGVRVNVTREQILSVIDTIRKQVTYTLAIEFLARWSKTIQDSVHSIVVLSDMDNSTGVRVPYNVVFYNESDKLIRIATTDFLEDVENTFRNHVYADSDIYVVGNPPVVENFVDSDFFVIPVLFTERAELNA